MYRTIFFFYVKRFSHLIPSLGPTITWDSFFLLQFFEERPLFSACFWGLGWTIWSQHSSPFPPWQLKDQFRNLRFVLVGTRSLSWGSRFLRPSQECAERQSWKSSSETLKKEEAKGTKGSSQQRNVYNIKLEHFPPNNVPIEIFFNRVETSPGMFGSSSWSQLLPWIEHFALLILWTSVLTLYQGENNEISMLAERNLWVGLQMSSHGRVKDLQKALEPVKICSALWQVI